MEAAALSLSWELPSTGQFEGDSCAVGEVGQEREWEQGFLAPSFSMHVWNLPFTVLPCRDCIHPFIASFLQLLVSTLHVHICVCMLETDPKTSNMVATCSTTELQSHLMSFKSLLTLPPDLFWS